ncbi:MAG: tartrate dehydrogenase [Actinobacteria bacterium]|nr:tartrate dehydrogenase [Actinomycetota bacterium]
MTESIRIACIPGDGVGPEVVAQAQRVLEAVAEVHGGVKFDFVDFPWSCSYYLEHGTMMPEDALEILAPFDAIILGAVGWPGVPDHVSLWGLLIPIRRHFQQYVNLRPVKLLRGMRSPLRDREPGDIDFVVVRENSEGEYSDMGGRIHSGTPHEVAVQVNYFSRMGIERTTRYAFELAKAEGRSEVIGATKSNGIVYSMPFWDDVFNEVAEDYPQLKSRLVLADALAAFVVTQPHTLDVIVASNLLGDLLTDIGGAIMGSIGMAPAANLNPEGEHPSMFEPVHGSAPDIAGKGVANPIGQIWTVKMLLDAFDFGDLPDAVLDAIEDVLVAGIKTPDLGGRATTQEVGDAIVDRILGRGGR